MSCVTELWGKKITLPFDTPTYLEGGNEIQYAVKV
jgi:hypothetical protein